MRLHHQRAGGNWRDHVPSPLDPGAERRSNSPGAAAHLGDIPPLQLRHPAACVVDNLGLDPILPEHALGGAADPRVVVLDEASGVEHGLTPRGRSVRIDRRRGLSGLPAEPAGMEAGQHRIAVNAGKRLHERPREPIAAARCPVGERRDERPAPGRCDRFYPTRVQPGRSCRREGHLPADASSGRENPPRGRAAACRDRPDSTCRRACRPRPRSRSRRSSPRRRRPRGRSDRRASENSRRGLRSGGRCGRRQPRAAARCRARPRRGTPAPPSRWRGRGAGRSCPATACPPLSAEDDAGGLGNDLHRPIDGLVVDDDRRRHEEHVRPNPAEEAARHRLGIDFGSDTVGGVEVLLGLPGPSRTRRRT